MIQHHPNDLTLAVFAAATLDDGRSLVVATHLSMCPKCRHFLSELDHVGGHLLHGLVPVAMPGSAVSRTLDHMPRVPSLPDARMSMPGETPHRQPTLSNYRMGAWRWIGPGLRRRSVEIPSLTETRVFMLKAAAGLKLPEHRHTGSELTMVLAGAFTHRGGRFAVGDIDDADEGVEHDPVVDPAEDCVCLVAMHGRLRLNGLLGRLIEPFVSL